MNQFYAPPLTKLNKGILIAAGGCFLVASILKAIGAFPLVGVLGLSANGLFHGLVYQLVTYPFVEVQLMSFLFNALVVWFIGSELEAQWGTKIYLRFLILVVVGVGLVFSLVNLAFFFGTSVYSASLYGLSGINFALLIAYSLLFPDRQMAFMMVFPIRARTFCWILAGIEAYLAIFSNIRTSWAHLLAMGLSYLIIHFQTNPLIRKALHTSWKPRGGGGKSSGKKHLYVVKDEDQKPPKYWQ
jgi:membrane associated rhomboid family serine protease